MSSPKVSGPAQVALTSQSESSSDWEKSRKTGGSRKSPVVQGILDTDSNFLWAGRDYGFTMKGDAYTKLPPEWNELKYDDLRLSMLRRDLERDELSLRADKSTFADQHRIILKHQLYHKASVELMVNMWHEQDKVASQVDDLKEKNRLQVQINDKLNQKLNDAMSQLKDVQLMLTKSMLPKCFYCNSSTHKTK